MSTYILPAQPLPFPGGLNLTQFIQAVLVGISGIDGTLVRPQWQVEPPKSPDILVNWMAFGISVASPNANLYIETDNAGVTRTQRMETLEIASSIYGPDALEIAALITDGFQIPNNLEGLRSAKMGFIEVSPTRRVPDLVNERFVDRIQMSIFLTREIQRVYPILSILSANGTIHTVIGNEEYLLDWSTQS